MSECFLEASEDLNLENNQLSGHLTNQFGEFKSLQHLDLGRNSFSGAIPFSIGKLSSLELLRLDGNKFTETLPESLGQLFNLQLLDIYETELLTSENQLSLKASPNWNPPFNLIISKLRRGAWVKTLRFPHGFRSRRILRILIYPILESQAEFQAGFGRSHFGLCLITISMARSKLQIL
ncbi:hypothetical protein ACS0TY_035310 [Phlomoides rotata]